MTEILKQTALYQSHRQLGAKMVGFGGWEMPLQYQGILAEHRAVRSHSGIFDVSHMTKFWCEGREALAKLELLVPSDLAKLQPGQAQYTVLLNQSGGVIDDLIFYYFGDYAWLIIANAATKNRVEPWLKQHLGDSLSDRYQDDLLLALQGQQSIGILQQFVDLDLSQLQRFNHQKVKLLGHSAWIARTGYTGEDGFELMTSPQLGIKIWQQLLECGVTACGLGCRDTLRLEAGMHLYGQELNESISPLEAGLAWLVQFDKGDFIGRTVLESQLKIGISKKLVALTMNQSESGKNIARPGYPIFVNQVEDQSIEVGKITSGTLSPSLGSAIALGYVPTHLSKLGQQLEVRIRDRYCGATVVKRPHYRKKC